MSYRDKRIADEVVDDRSLYCSAHRCPLRWSVDAGRGRLCTHHAWAPLERWPSITQALLDGEAHEAQHGKPQEPPVRVLSAAEKRETLRRMSQVEPPQPREVVDRLIARERAGEVMSRAQREFLAVAKRKFYPEDQG